MEWEEEAAAFKVPLEVDGMTAALSHLKGVEIQVCARDCVFVRLLSHLEDVCMCLCMCSLSLSLAHSFSCHIHTPTNTLAPTYIQASRRHDCVRCALCV